MMNVMTFVALAEPNRLRIVELLRETSPCSVGEIARKLLLRQPQVSKHLRVLNEAGLVAVRPRAQHRFYELESKSFDELDDWVRSFRRLEGRFRTLERLREEMKSPEIEDED